MSLISKKRNEETSIRAGLSYVFIMKERSMLKGGQSQALYLSYFGRGRDLDSGYSRFLKEVTGIIFSFVATLKHALKTFSLDLSEVYHTHNFEFSVA